ncbi:EamA family transporter [Flammeovirga agarivorans]|uniref:EamA family transporter n=1 Tax=Flammeovirga agarivorans TaxID=2726742 RepID=A0A7X8SK07_9BACT|nr:EamA family transporter [Flammeovirga agarivorans]NLR91659.1 EamA family transporter [Flammeovirga agarivorans]
MNLQRSNFKTVFALTALYIGWGSTYMAIAVTLEYFPPFLLGGIRFIIAGLLFLFWSLLQGQKLPKIKELLQICFIGLFLLFLGSGSVVWVEQYLSTGLTSIVWASLPIWLVAMDKKRWSYYRSNKKLLFGLLVGFLGVILLFGDDEFIQSIDLKSLVAYCIAFFGVICFAFGSLKSQQGSFQSDTILIVAIQMLCVGLLSMVISFLLDEKLVPHTTQSGLEALYGLIYLIVVGSLIAYFSYVWLLKVLPPSIVGTYTYINPAIAILLGWWFLKETVSVQKVLALLLIFIGVVLINYYKSKNINENV